MSLPTGPTARVRLSLAWRRGFRFFCSAQCMLAARLGASLRADLSDAVFCQVPLTCDRNATAGWAGYARRPDDNRRCGAHLSRVWEFRCGAARCFPGMKKMLRRITMCICSRLQAAGCKVVDDGNVAIPAIFHIIPFRLFRSWPGPRIVWNCVSERITPVLQRSGQVPLLIGCDYSVVDRTTQALLHASSLEIHILHIDGDFDDSPPDGRRSQSAASCAVGLLMNNSPFWAGSALRPDVCGGGNHDDVRVGGAPAAGGARGECRSGFCAADGIKFDTVPPRGS